MVTDSVGLDVGLEKIFMSLALALRKKYWPWSWPWPWKNFLSLALALRKKSWPWPRKLSPWKQDWRTLVHLTAELLLSSGARKRIKAYSISAGFLCFCFAGFCWETIFSVYVCVTCWLLVRNNMSHKMGAGEPPRIVW